MGVVRHECPNCDNRYDDESLPKTLWQIHKLAERLKPGEECPSGECECGAVTHLIKPRTEHEVSYRATASFSLRKGAKIKVTHEGDRLMIRGINNGVIYLDALTVLPHGDNSVTVKPRTRPEAGLGPV